MAKTRFDVNSLLPAYLERLEQDLDVEHIFFMGESYDGINDELSDVRFIVVSPTFERMDHLRRLELLGRAGLAISPVIQAWAFTPNEIARHFSGEGYDLFLAQFLQGSREVYARSPRRLRKAAGGKR